MNPGLESQLKKRRHTSFTNWVVIDKPVQAPKRCNREAHLIKKIVVICLKLIVKLMLYSCHNNRRFGYWLLEMARAEELYRYSSLKDTKAQFLDFIYFLFILLLKAQGKLLSRSFRFDLTYVLNLSMKTLLM